MAADVVEARERDRRRRLRRLAYLLAPLAGWLWFRALTGNPVSPGLPDLPDEAMFWLPGILIILLLAIVLVGPMLGNGRSPHLIYLPEQIEVDFGNVKGLGAVVPEVRHTLKVFLNYRDFRFEMGGTPRRGVLFEGPPGTGKTHMAKAMAKEAGVPFLFVSSTAFQSMWYGATARKIRSYFRQLRKVAQREGGAIGFIEEIDAIATRRGGLNATPAPAEATIDVNRAGISQGTGGVVNELLVQMQSFDEPTRRDKAINRVIRYINRFFPPHRQFKTRPPLFANVLIIGATNRADSLDPALLRPGRFDRILHFGLPGKQDRRDLIDYFLERKAHDAELDDPKRRNDLAGTTMGYSPASLERLFDEALLSALRQGRRAFTWSDLRRAQLEVEIGLPQSTEYPAEEREAIAVHEAGHAAMAYLVGKSRRLEVLSIIKRRDSLGLLAHRDEYERYTRGQSEMKTLLQIALGGMVAEEIFFHESGTGPAGDLAAATRLACDMVGSFGMGGSLISFSAIDPGVVGGNLTARVIGDSTARKQVDTLLNDAKHETTRLLTEHRYLIEALRDALLDREELLEQEILEVVRRAEAGALDAGRVVVDLRHDPSRIVPGGRDIELRPAPGEPGSVEEN